MSIFYSYAELDEIGEAIVREYYKKSDISHLSVDVEGLAEKHLGLPVQYLSIAEKDSDKIGFISDGKTPIRVCENGKVMSRVYPRGTIIIEKALRSKQENGRRRFTIAHEIAHYLIDNSLKAANFSRVFDKERSYTLDELHDLMNIRETQVDRLAASILMPRSLVVQNVKQVTGKERIPLYGSGVLDHADRILIHRVADLMGASMTAMTSRLRELDLFEYRPIDEYIVKIAPEQGGNT